MYFKRVLERQRSSRVQVWTGVKLVLSLKFPSFSSHFLMVSFASDEGTQVKIKLYNCFTWNQSQMLDFVDKVHGVEHVLSSASNHD